jgi:tRNA A-37 threonylcarbamoyl transferase component Bud32
MQVESLGRYRIEKELGRGAMGRVFLAYDPTIDRRVAIKTIQVFASLPEADRAQARERFLREARSAGKLLHPGIVTIFDVGEADGVPYLAMEFVDGETLDAACREEALLPVPVVVALVAAAADALGFAHARGIIHRDIKPANLMRVGDRAVKIMDFGLAKSQATSMTHDGALFGTPNYMSPEQVRGEPLDGRTDLFSLGVVCYEMLTGVKPFAGDSISSVLYRIVHETPRDAPVRLDRVAPPLATFLDRALAKHPAARFEDAAEFAAALRRAGAAAGSATARARVPPVRPLASSARQAPLATSRRSLVPWMVVVVLALAGIGAAIVLHLPPFASPRVAMLMARIRTEPPGLSVRLNGAPLGGDIVRFAAGGPFEVLTASRGCREAKHRLEAADAGGEIVLVLDPAEAAVAIDAGVPGARLTVNGQGAGTAPITIDLDLCRDNTIEVRAEGYRSASATIPAKATPLDARNAAGALTLEVIPTGRLLLPTTRVPTLFFVDGKPAVRSGGGMDLPAGTHEVRARNEERFVDVAVTLEVPSGGTATPAFPIPALAWLVVQTFPPNCRVALKRAGSPWRPVGEAPLRYELAAGSYVLRVESPVSGESREQDISLAPGMNAPVRVSFGRTGR